MAATIELYLVRHAIAAERGPKYPDDRLRPADPGRREEVRGLGAGPCDDGRRHRLRADQSAGAGARNGELLAAGLKPKPALVEIEALAPGGRHQAVVEAIKTHAKRHRRLALVGHEPDLGELAARLLGARGSIEFKKGAVCLIEVDGATPGGPGTLRWMLPPKALRALVP